MNNNVILLYVVHVPVGTCVHIIACTIVVFSAKERLQKQVDDLQTELRKKVYTSWIDILVSYYTHAYTTGLLNNIIIMITISNKYSELTLDLDTL